MSGYTLILMMVAVAAAEDPRECKTTLNGLEYRGTMNVTNKGEVCKTWAECSTGWVDYFTSIGEPSEAQTNYCRNPDDDGRGPWCCTFDEFGNCDIPFCEEPATTTEPPTTTAQAPLPLGCTAASDCGENANCDEGACVCNPGFGGDPKVSCKEYCTCEFLGDPLLSTFEGILEMVAGDFSFFDIGVCGLSSRVFLALQGDQLYPVKLTIRFRDLDITIWKNKTVEYQDSSSTLPDTVTLTDTPQVIPTHPDVKLSLENGYALVDITCNGEPVQVGFDPEGAKTRGVVVVPQSLADSIGQDPDSECGQCSGGNTT